MSDYYTLNYERKPEHMGWNLQASPINDPELSGINYGDEIQQRLDRYADLWKRVDKVFTKDSPRKQRRVLRADRLPGTAPRRS